MFPTFDFDSVVTDVTTDEDTITEAATLGRVMMMDFDIVKEKKINHAQSSVKGNPVAIKISDFFIAEDVTDLLITDFTISGETISTKADPTQEVSPDNQQTFTSITGFDITVNNGSDSITLPITLKDVNGNQLELRKISRYGQDRDRIGKLADGKWYKENNIGSGVLTSSDITDISTSYNNADFIRFLKPADYYGYHMFEQHEWLMSMCSRATQPYDNYSNLYKYIGAINSSNMVIFVPKGMTLEEAQAKFNGMLYYYPLAIPTYTELCSADQSSLDAIERSFGSGYQGLERIINIALSTTTGEIKVSYNLYTTVYNTGDTVIRIENGRPVEATTLKEKVQMYLQMLLRTKIDKFKVYENTEFGMTYFNYLGIRDLPPGWIDSELKREIVEKIEKLGVIESVSDFNASFEGTTLTVTFSINLMDSTSETISGSVVVI